nr:uncharacterized protein LOC104119436 [Nicotiana tomentosiformis]
MIFGAKEINGVTFSAAKKTKVSVTHSKRLWEVDEEDITFTEEDADGLLLSHNDALLISLSALDFKIKCVLVDPGSSAKIIQWRVLEQVKLTISIVSATKLLFGFNLASMTTLGEILLPMNAEGIMKTTLFEVVDCDMGYNIILGIPWLHEIKESTPAPEPNKDNKWDETSGSHHVPRARVSIGRGSDKVGTWKQQLKLPTSGSTHAPQKWSRRSETLVAEARDRLRGKDRICKALSADAAIEPQKRKIARMVRMRTADVPYPREATPPIPRGRGRDWERAPA